VAPIQPLTNFITSDTIIPPRKKVKKWAGCNAAAQTRAPMAVSAVTPFVAAGSASSYVEITSAASVAAFSAQENPNPSPVAASATGDGVLSSLHFLIRRNC